MRKNTTTSLKKEAHNQFGVRLARERKRRHWTQEDLKEALNLGSTLTITRWENEQSTPRADMLKKLVEMFGPEETWGADRAQFWTIPFMRNLYFTGREATLATLHELVRKSAVAVTQPPTLSGLGGIGKTQTVLEYAHRYKDEYDAVLWVPADTREALVGKLAEFAALLGLPNHTDPNQLRQAKDVKQWLETQKKLTWLVIFDNVDDLAMVAEFLPTTGRGAILLTTRAHAVGNHLKKIELEKLSLKESVEFLLGRMGKKGYAGLNAFTETERPAAEHLCTLMDGLPLALDQAAAYIEEHRCTLAEYVSLYERQRADFLRFRNSVDTRDYPDSVATTWHLSFQQIQASPTATDLLHLLAFLHPDVIHLKELLRHRGAELTPSLKAMAKDTALLESAIDLVQK